MSLGKRKAWVEVNVMLFNMNNLIYMELKSTEISFYQILDNKLPGISEI